MLTRLTPERVAIGVAALLVATGILGLGFGSPAAFRNPHIAVAVVIAIVAMRAPETFAEALPERAWRILCMSSLVWCALSAWTHWASFQVNGVDFSIFDWMLENTHRGKFGYTPIYAENHFGVHSSFLLLLLVPLHALVPSPLWLVAAGPIAIWAGVFPLRRLSRSLVGSHGGLELTLALAWFGNSWLGHLINDAFRIESLAPVFSLWFLVGWVEKRRVVVFSSLFAMLCIKEDATLALACFALASLVVERVRWRDALAVFAFAVGFFLAYTQLMQPALLGRATPGYLSFWSDFGDSTASILRSMVTSPVRVLERLLTSHWYLFFGPLLCLSFLSLQGTAGLFPTFFLIGVANYSQMHDYEGYYPSPMVPYALFAMIQVAARFRHRRRWWLATVTGLLAFPLFQGDYARSVTIDWSIREGLPAARAALAQESSSHCVQTALMPHVGYPPQIEPIFAPECVDEPGASGLIHPLMSRYPLGNEQFDQALARWRAAGRTRDLPGGFIYVGPVATPLR